LNRFFLGSIFSNYYSCNIPTLDTANVKGKPLLRYYISNWILYCWTMSLIDYLYQDVWLTNSF
jgi:hypothetical protein